MNKLVLAITAVVALSGCSSVNLDDVKANAEATYAQAGHTIEGYEGYQFGLGIPKYNGARVWYLTKKDGVNYNSYIRVWDNEYHIHRMRALDAVTNR